MNTGPWEKPVTFETATLGRYRTISSTTEAARVLLEEWPIESGKALKRAKAACIAVLAGTKEPEAARKAFLQAASEAKVFIRE